jgi:hypothetical protein
LIYTTSQKQKEKKFLYQLWSKKYKPGVVMKANNKAKKADILIQKINVYLAQMGATVQYIWIQDADLYIRLHESFADQQEKQRIQSVLELLIKEDLNFVSTVHFIEGDKDK